MIASPLPSRARQLAYRADTSSAGSRVEPDQVRSVLGERAGCHVLWDLVSCGPRTGRRRAAGRRGIVCRCAGRTAAPPSPWSTSSYARPWSPGRSTASTSRRGRIRRRCPPQGAGRLHDAVQADEVGEGDLLRYSLVGGPCAGRSTSRPAPRGKVIAPLHRRIGSPPFARIGAPTGVTSRAGGRRGSVSVAGRAGRRSSRRAEGRLLPGPPRVGVGAVARHVPQIPRLRHGEVLVQDPAAPSCWACICTIPVSARQLPSLPRPELDDWPSGRGCSPRSARPVGRGRGVMRSRRLTRGDCVAASAVACSRLRAPPASRRCPGPARTARTPGRSLGRAVVPGGQMPIKRRRTDPSSLATRRIVTAASPSASATEIAAVVICSRLSSAGRPVVPRPRGAIQISSRTITTSLCEQRTQSDIFFPNGVRKVVGCEIERTRMAPLNYCSAGGQPLGRFR